MKGLLKQFWGQLGLITFGFALIVLSIIVDVIGIGIHPTIVLGWKQLIILVSGLICVVFGTGFVAIEWKRWSIRQRLLKSMSVGGVFLAFSLFLYILLSSRSSLVLPTFLLPHIDLHAILRLIRNSWVKIFESCPLLITTVLTFLGVGITHVVLRKSIIKGSLINYLQELNEYHHLLSLWLKYQIQSRYTQTFLGILWIVLLPLAEALVLTFAFTQLLGSSANAEIPFVTFIFSGRIFFSIFQQMVGKARAAIVSNMSVIEQVYFPREIILLLILGESLVDFFFMFIVMLIINAIFKIFPSIYYFYLPIPILIMIVLSLGTAFLVSLLGLMIRDMQQFIGIILQLLSYMTILYSPSRAKLEVPFWVHLNPLLGLTEFFRTITIYNQPPDFRQLISPTALAIGLLWIGYITFKTYEKRFGDYS